MATTRIATAGTYNSGDLISASDINAMPGGTIGRDTLVSDSAGTTGTENVCSVSPSVGTDREVTIHATANLQASDVSGAFMAIFEDGIQLQRRNCQIPAVSTDTPLTTFIVSYPAPGSHQYDIATGVSGGGGETVTCVNNGYTGTRGVTQLLVVDTGPSF